MQNLTYLMNIIKDYIYSFLQKANDQENKQKSRKGLFTQLRELASLIIIDSTLNYKLNTCVYYISKKRIEITINILKIFVIDYVVVIKKLSHKICVNPLHKILHYRLIYAPINPFVLIISLRKEGAFDEASDLLKTINNFLFTNLKDQKTFTEIQAMALKEFDWALPSNAIETMAQKFLEGVCAQNMEIGFQLAKTLNKLNDLTSTIFKVANLNNTFAITASPDPIEIVRNSALSYAPEPLMPLPEVEVYKTISEQVGDFLGDHWAAILITIVVIGLSVSMYHYIQNKPLIVEDVPKHLPENISTNFLEDKTQLNSVFEFFLWNFRLDTIYLIACFNIVFLIFYRTTFIVFFKSLIKNNIYTKNLYLFFLLSTLMFSILLGFYVNIQTANIVMCISILSFILYYLLYTNPSSTNKHNILLTLPSCCYRKSTNFDLVYYYKGVKNIGRTTTFLTKYSSIKICKRNYPGNGILPRGVLGKIIPRNSSLVLYDPQITYKLLQCRSYDPVIARECFYRNNSKRPNMNHINTEAFTKTLQPQIDTLTEYLQGNPDIIKDPEMVVCIIDSILLDKKTLLPKYLATVLQQLLDVETLSLNQKNVLISLRKYFQENHPTIENAQMFLTIWNKGNYPFTPLSFISQDNVKSEVREDDTNKVNVFKQKSYDEKLQEAHFQFYIRLKKIQDLLALPDANLFKALDENFLKDFYNLLENRGSILPLFPEEILFQDKLKQLYGQNKPSKDALLKIPKDNLKQLKEESSLPKELFHVSSSPCFLPEDYNIEINHIKEALMYLQTNDVLSMANLKILAISSSVAVLDEEGTFKLTQEAYKSFAEHANTLGFQYLNSVPQKEYILNKIINKEFIIVNEIASLANSIVDPAHLSHKTMVISDDILGKNILVRVGLLTSTKDSTTILLDKYQQTNPDIDKQSKKQFYRIFNNFILVDHQEPITIDLETTLFLQHVNSNMEDISRILYGAYESENNNWSTNYYQLSYKADEKLLYKLSIIFFKKRLEMLEDEAKKLNVILEDLYNNDTDKYRAKLKQLQNLKETYLLEKKNQQYFSLLPDKFKVMHKIITLFEKVIVKDKLKQEKREAKERVKKELLAKELQQKEIQVKKTATDLKNDYLKIKQQFSNENNTNEQDY